MYVADKCSVLGDKSANILFLDKFLPYAYAGHGILSGHSSNKMLYTINNADSLDCKNKIAVLVN